MQVWVTAYVSILLVLESSFEQEKSERLSREAFKQQIEFIGPSSSSLPGSSYLSAIQSTAESEAAERIIKLQREIREKEEIIKAHVQMITELDVEQRTADTNLEEQIRSIDSRASTIREDYFGKISLLKQRLEEVLSRPRYIAYEKFSADVAQLKAFL